MTPATGAGRLMTHTALTGTAAITLVRVDKPTPRAATMWLHASVKTTYPAALHIFIPGATMLAESIDCTPGTDGMGRLRWYYRWSWGELLHDTEDPSAAAAKIAEVLSSR
jgi:hypothetical protein